MWNNSYIEMVSFIYKNIAIPFVFCASFIAYATWFIWGVVFIASDTVAMMYILYSLTSFICFLGYFIVILRLFLLR
jgi:hypothetical protein